MRTLIQVQFTPIGDDRTRVDLTQSRWQGLGDAAAKIRDSYEAGWDDVFATAYKAACDG